MRKTTIYLKDDELELLKQKAFLLNTSVADLIRKVIATLIAPSSAKEDQAMKALSAIRSQFADKDAQELVDEAITAQREIRSRKKTSGRH